MISPSINSTGSIDSGNLKKSCVVTRAAVGVCVTVATVLSSSNRHSAVGHDPVDRVYQLRQVAHLKYAVTDRPVLVHVAIARTPLRGWLRIEPQQTAAP